MNPTLHKLKILLESTLDILLPHTCIGCRSWSDGLVCQSCNTALTQANIQTRQFLPEITSALSILDYQGLTESLIHAYKFAMLQNLSHYFTQIILTHLPQNPYQNAIWTPVPFHTGRRKLRGYDHVRLIFEPVLKHWNTPLIDIAYRAKNTPHLYDLPPAQRQQALANAFQLHQNIDITNASIVIVDDILTTGSTTRELAKLFKSAGATNIHVIALAGGRYRIGNKQQKMDNVQKT